jgi:putative Mg2+ transporter-C (MgtC) family protein
MSHAVRANPAAGRVKAEQLPLLSDVDFALRLLVTAILAIAIGFEREFHGHPAGIKTLGLVGVGACLFSGLGLEAFRGSTDPTRIAAQVVTGVGFLGAGAILRQGNEVHGLTTAASIWVVAAIGMAVGFGFYVPAVFTTLLILAMLVLLRPVEMLLFHRYKKIQEAVEVKIVPP